MSRTASSRRRSDQDGFSLVELLVSITILGVISFALTEAVILGLKLTDGTVTKVSGAAAARALVSRFPADAQSADEVAPTGDCASAETGVFLHMSWIDQGVTRAVAYAFEPPTGTEQDLVRWSCANGLSDRRFVGHFSRDAAGPAPVVVSCTDANDAIAPCTARPAAITLSIRPDPQSPANTLTVRRRAQ